MPVFEDTAQVGDDEVVTGRLGTFEEGIGFEHAERRLAGFARLPVPLGELRMGWQGHDVDLPAGRLGEFADGTRITPDPMAPGCRQGGRLEPQAESDRARRSARVEDEHPDRLLVALDGADARASADERRDLNGEGRLAHATGKARHADESKAWQDMGDCERPLLRLPFIVRKVRAPSPVLLQPDDA